MRVTPTPGDSFGESRCTGTPSQTLSVNIAETEIDTHRRFQLEMSECVETKTVTTTTRLTRKFPQVFIRNPTPLEALDTKEYPLATKPTPPEIADFSYHVSSEDDESQESDVILFVRPSSTPFLPVLSANIPQVSRSSVW